MKQIYPFFILAITFIILQTSCSIEKRLYNPGYSVEYKKSCKQIIKTSAKDNRSMQSEISKKDISELTDKKNGCKQACIEDKLLKSFEFNHYLTLKQTTNKSLITEMSEGCDTILMKDGDEVSAKIIEVTDDKVRYKRCDNLNGPDYTIAKSKILRIQYANGTSETISDDDTESSVKSSDDSEPIDKSDRKVESNGVIGLILGILGAIFIGLSFSVMEVELAAALLGVGMIFAILAIVLGLIGMIRSIVLHKRYKGIGNGILAQIIGILTIVALYAYSLTL